MGSFCRDDHKQLCELPSCGRYNVAHYILTPAAPPQNTSMFEFYTGPPCYEITTFKLTSSTLNEADESVEDLFDVQVRFDDALEGTCLNFTDSRHIMEWCHNRHFKKYHRGGQDGDCEVDEALRILTIQLWTGSLSSHQQNNGPLWTNPRVQQFFAPLNADKRSKANDYFCKRSFNVTLIFECPENDDDDDNATTHMNCLQRHLTMSDCDSVDSSYAVVSTKAACRRNSAAAKRNKDQKIKILLVYFNLLLKETLKRLNDDTTSSEQQSRLVQLLVRSLLVDTSVVLPTSFSMRSMITISGGAVNPLYFRPDILDAQELLKLLMEQAKTNPMYDTLLLPLLRKAINETTIAYNNKTLPTFITRSTAVEHCLLEIFWANSLLATSCEAAIEGTLMDVMEQVQRLSEEELEDIQNCMQRISSDCIVSVCSRHRTLSYRSQTKSCSAFFVKQKISTTQGRTANCNCWHQCIGREAVRIRSHPLLRTTMQTHRTQCRGLAWCDTILSTNNTVLYRLIKHPKN